jgi:hypothetical protein
MIIKINSERLSTISIFYPADNESDEGKEVIKITSNKDKIGKFICIDQIVDGESQKLDIYQPVWEKLKRVVNKHFKE